MKTEEIVKASGPYKRRKENYLMSSRIDVKCPRCGNKGLCTASWDLKEFKEHFTCFHCGYWSSTKGILDETNSKPGYRCYIKKQRIIKPSGVLRVEWRNRQCLISTPLRYKPSKEPKLVAAFKKMIEKAGVDKRRSYLTWWDEKKKELFYLVGSAKRAEDALRSTKAKLKTGSKDN